MTQEAAIKFKDEIKAFQEGKQIQVFTRKWVDDNNPSFSIKSKYRVKPQETKRLPTIEEVEQWFVENRVFKENFPKTELKRQTLVRIQSLIPRGNVMLLIVSEWYTLEVFCNEFTHYDGSSLYITE